MNDLNTEQYATIDKLAARKAFFEYANGPSLHESIDEVMDGFDGMSVLDVGCGYGSDLKSFNNNYQNLIGAGLDLSEGQISEAQKETSDNLNFHVGNAENYKLDQQFDRILMKHSLHLVTKKRVALQNAINHLKPSGKLIIVLHSDSTQPKLQGWIDWFTDLYKLRSLNRKDLTIERDNRLFDNFENIERKDISKSIIIKDPSPYIGYIDSIRSRFRPKLIDYKWQSFIDYTTRNIQNDIDKYGKFEETSTNGIVIITK